MELILWRHAEAEDGGDDMARALTKRGHRQAALMAAWLGRRVDAKWLVLCSPARRALQTVEPLKRPFEVRDRLSPMAGAEDVLRESGWPDAKVNVIVVGHQPTLGQVAASLMGAGLGDISMRKGAIWWFATRQRAGAHETILKAVLNPGLLED
jgi:phosphohistidine phosphatase